MTILDIRYTDSQYRQFFAYVRQEWTDKPFQLMKHGATNALCVRGQFSEAEESRLLDLVNEFEAALRDAPQVVINHTPMSHKRRIRQQHYRQ